MVSSPTRCSLQSGCCDLSHACFILHACEYNREATANLSAKDIARYAAICAGCRSGVRPSANGWSALVMLFQSKSRETVWQEAVLAAEGRKGKEIRAMVEGGVAGAGGLEGRDRKSEILSAVPFCYRLNLALIGPMVTHRGPAL